MNPSDLLTKHVSESLRLEYMKRLGLEQVEGRHHLAPALVNDHQRAEASIAHVRCRVQLMALTQRSMTPSRRFCPLAVSSDNSRGSKQTITLHDLLLRAREDRGGACGQPGVHWRAGDDRQILEVELRAEGGRRIQQDARFYSQTAAGVLAEGERECNVALCDPKGGERHMYMRSVGSQADSPEWEGEGGDVGRHRGEHPERESVGADGGSGCGHPEREDFTRQHVKSSGAGAVVNGCVDNHFLTSRRAYFTANVLPTRWLSPGACRETPPSPSPPHAIWELPSTL